MAIASVFGMRLCTATCTIAPFSAWLGAVISMASLGHSSAIDKPFSAVSISVALKATVFHAAAMARTGMSKADAIPNPINSLRFT